MTMLHTESNLTCFRVRFETPDEHNPIKVIFKREAVTNEKGTKNYVLRLIIKNVRWEDETIGKIVPKCKWTRTRKAEKVYVYVHFFNQEGKSIVKQPMAARLSEPIHANRLSYQLPLALHSQTIYPNMEFCVDLVIKLEGASECYGLWRQNAYSSVESVTNSNVFINGEEAGWRKTDEMWRLESGIYKIIIEAYTEGQILKRDYFQLINLDDQFKVEKTPKFKQVN